jgi:hypothetical protein
LILTELEKSGKIGGIILPRRRRRRNVEECSVLRGRERETRRDECMVVA